MITGLSGDKQFTANYDPDLQISSINHALPQAFDENYTYDDNGNYNGPGFLGQKGCANKVYSLE